MDEITKYILGNLPGIIGALLSIFLAYRQFKKEKFELNRAFQRAPVEDNKTAIETSNSAAAAVKSYSDEIAELRAEMAEMRKQVNRLQEELDEKDRIIEDWRIGIEKLIGQLRDRRIVPVWQPASANIPSRPRKEW